MAAEHEIVQSSDVDVLWKALVGAKADGDATLVRAIEGRMRELQGTRRFAHLSDADLERQLAGLTAQREPGDLLAYSPDRNGGDGAAGTAALNRAIKEGQVVGIEATRAALLAERARRRQG